MSTPIPEQPVPEQPEQPPAKSRKRWWILGGVLALVVLFILIPTDDEEPNEAGTTPPAATSEEEAATEDETTVEDEPAPETTEPADPTTEEPAEPEDAWDPEVAREELLDYIYEVNGARTIEDVCDTEKLTEGTWWQCYFEDLEWATETRVQVNLATPGDVDVDAIGEDARRWFVTMLADYPGLEQVTTFVNGLDTGTDSL